MYIYFSKSFIDFCCLAQLFKTVNFSRSRKNILQHDKTKVHRFSFNNYMYSSITLVHSNLNKHSSSINKKVGEALFLTPLIETEDIRKARKKATVQHREMKNVESYAGYVTVNKTYNSNKFFWYFPSQVIAYLFYYY